MTIFEQFAEAFDQLDKEACIQITFDALSVGEIGIVDLYEGVLRRSLVNLTDKEVDPQHKIWKEHIQSSIVRTVLEMAFPFVIKQRQTHVKGKAAIVCPDQEQHELGARMVSDYMSLLGYQTLFVGRNTPKEEFNDMISTLSLDVVALSVTNYYNLSSAIKTVEMIRAKFPQIKIIVGGLAIQNNPQSLANLNVEITRNYSELQRALVGGAL